MAQRRGHVQPKRGDLIEILRGNFYHWAIYVGDGDVVHLTTTNAEGLSKTGFTSSPSVLSEMGIVRKESLSSVVRNDTFCVKNHLDNKYEPRSVGTILSDARSRVGQNVPYSVIGRNCEHFVTELRYGKSESRQVLQAAEVMGGALLGGGVLGAAVLFIIQFVMILLRIS